jgi:hypothetical protein
MRSAGRCWSIPTCLTYEEVARYILDYQRFSLVRTFAKSVRLVPAFAI